jgi:magnesium chelatase family protein
MGMLLIFYKFQDMAIKVFSATPHGIDAKIVEVEVDCSPGLPGTFIVGLPDPAIRESKERLRGCFRHVKGIRYPIGKTIINLAPASLHKYGTQFDLAIAVGILIASKQIAIDQKRTLFLGELSLDGSLRKIRNCLAMVMAAKEENFDRVCLPVENYDEAALIQGIEIIALASLSSFLVGVAEGFSKLVIKEKPQRAADDYFGDDHSYTDFAEIIGQSFAKRGLEIAAAGGHNLLMFGSPGSGKTMLASALPSILPILDDRELLECMKIYNAAGKTETRILRQAIRPFRNPQQGITSQAFVGGGTYPKPGELTLANAGVLFMDEFPEFPRAIIEALRQPLENGTINVSRQQGSFLFPASFILVAAQNPCACGYFGDPLRSCSCSALQILRYQKKVSGPVMDRIDMHMHIQKLKQSDGSNLVYYSPGNNMRREESSEIIRARVVAARAAQSARNPRRVLNARLSAKELATVGKLPAEALALLAASQRTQMLSMRGWLKIVKIARTIADLELSKNISAAHVAEALRYKFAGE